MHLYFKGDDVQILRGAKDKLRQTCGEIGTTDPYGNCKNYSQYTSVITREAPAIIDTDSYRTYLAAYSNKKFNLVAALPTGGKCPPGTTKFAAESFPNLADVGDTCRKESTLDLIFPFHVLLNIADETSVDAKYKISKSVRIVLLFWVTFLFSHQHPVFIADLSQHRRPFA